MRCSVVVPAYNAADTITATLSGILANLADDDELLLIDDGSQDQTAEVSRKLDPRVQVITIENSGPAKARNKGIELASGELIAFCDADDIWHADKLRLQRECFEKNPALGLCFTDYQVIDPQDNILTRSAVADRNLPQTHTVASMFAANPVCTSSAVVRRAAMNEIGGFPDTYHKELDLHVAGEDFESWIAIAERYPVEMLSRVLVSYRKMPAGAFEKTAGNRRGAQELLRRRIALIKATSQRRPDLLDSSQARAAIAEHYFRSAYALRQDGSFVQSAVMTLRSIFNDPFRVKSYLILAAMPVLALKHRRS